MHAAERPPTDAELTVLAERLAAALLAGSSRLASAESCTGGWIAKVATDLPGSSGWFEAGLVTYSNQAKMALLGVQAATLEQHGAVSEATVREMAAGALAATGVEVAVAVTGIAGPGGAVPGKPVGSVWIGWQWRDGEAVARRFLFRGDREAVRRLTVQAALTGLLESLTV
ncbi:CinA family protein [Frateuria aurantia]